MQLLKVKDVMSKDPVTIKPEQTVQYAARLMKDNGYGVLPVGTLAHVYGILTDRDVTVRVVAENKDASNLPVSQIMNEQVFFCEEDDSLDEAADRMRRHDVSRLVVTNGKTVTGIVTLADLLRNKGDKKASKQVMYELLYPKDKQEKHKPACCS